MLQAIHEFHQQLDQTPSTKLNHGNYPIDSTLVRILLTAGSAKYQIPSASARRLLADLFSLEQEKLEKAGLHYLSKEWHKLSEKWHEKKEKRTSRH